MSIFWEFFLASTHFLVEACLKDILARVRCGDLLIYDVDAAWRIEHAEDGPSYLCKSMFNLMESLLSKKKLIGKFVFA